jgi:hypothetical protein
MPFSSRVEYSSAEFVNVPTIRGVIFQNTELSNNIMLTRPLLGQAERVAHIRGMQGECRLKR